MRYTIERLPESRVAIDVEVEPDAVEKALERASQRLSRRHPIRGFRPGKAPRRIVEAVYGRDALYEEAADELLARAYVEILQHEKFEPVAEATVDTIRYEPFSFRLVVPVQPTVTLCDYRSLRFPLEPEPVTEEQVDARIEELRLAQLVWREPEPPRPAALGDRCLVDIRLRYEDGTEEYQEDVDLVLEAGGFPPGLAEGLVGAQVGEVREVEIAFPEDIANDALAGQKARATVTVRAIRAPELPTVDDAWARSLGLGESLAELRARVRREMEEQALQKARAKVVDQMIETILERSVIDLPQVLVDREAQRYQLQVSALLRRMGTSLDRYLERQGMSRQEHLERNRDHARRALGRALIVAELAKVEGITVTQEELSKVQQDEVDPEEQEQLRFEAMYRKLEERLLAIALGQEPEDRASEEAPAVEACGATGDAEATAARIASGTEMPVEPAPET